MTSSPSWVSATRHSGDRGERLDEALQPHGDPGTTSRTLLVAENPEQVVAQAVADEATKMTAVAVEYDWRLGRIIDPFGQPQLANRQLLVFGYRPNNRSFSRLLLVVWGVHRTDTRHQRHETPTPRRRLLLRSGRCRTGRPQWRRSDVRRAATQTGPRRSLTCPLAVLARAGVRFATNAVGQPCVDDRSVGAEQQWDRRDQHLCWLFLIDQSSDETSRDDGCCSVRGSRSRVLPLRGAGVARLAGRDLLCELGGHRSPYGIPPPLRAESLV